jgi:cbb3-type cytochrome oxidase maturation protein
MDILLLLIPVSLLLLMVGGALFWWTVNSGQYDDLDSPAQRILFDDDQDMVPERPDRSGRNANHTVKNKESDSRNNDRS